jgi:transposase
MTPTFVGVDIAKTVFHLHWVDGETGEVVSLQLKRAKFLEHFALPTACVIGFEAWRGSQHWARELVKFGHDVRLLPRKAAKPFAGGNRNDAADARAIWLAVQQPGVKTVAVKSEAQAVLGLHRMRSQLVKFRTVQINGLRGLLAEFGEQSIEDAQARCVISRPPYRGFQIVSRRC